MALWLIFPRVRTNDRTLSAPVFLDENLGRNDIKFFTVGYDTHTTGLLTDYGRQVLKRVHHAVKGIFIQSAESLVYKEDIHIQPFPIQVRQR